MAAAIVYTKHTSAGIADTPSITYVATAVQLHTVYCVLSEHCMLRVLTVI